MSNSLQGQSFARLLIGRRKSYSAALRNMQQKLTEHHEKGLDNMREIDGQWFQGQLKDKDKSMADLARHLELNPSSISRMFAGHRNMKMAEAQEIAAFLNAPLEEVLKHAGMSIDEDGSPSKILLVAVIGADGALERLQEPKPLPPNIIQRARLAIRDRSEEPSILAAQVRATGGALSIWDDAVVLFGHTTRVDPAAIGVLAICRLMSGEQMLGKIEKARKTGEATLVLSGEKTVEVMLQTATPVIAVIP